MGVSFHVSTMLEYVLWILIDWQILDADNGCRLESSTGRVATRDIVQFVPMREVLAGEHIYFSLAYYCPQY